MASEDRLDRIDYLIQQNKILEESLLENEIQGEKLKA